MDISTPTKTITSGSVITSLQKQYYERDGFLVLKNFIAKDVCDALITRANALVADFNPNTFKTIFSTHNQQHAKDHYFLDSADKIHFFFEEAALDEQLNLRADKTYCINKIGHGLHEADPLFYCYSHLHKLALLCEDVGINDPVILQSMYIFKQPKFGGEVTCHQDSTYLATKHEPVTGLWLALEDATLENGCLWAIPGGHHTTLKSRFMRDRHHRTHTEVYDTLPWELEKMIPLEVPRGTLVVLNGLLPHMSKENKSEKSRHAYALHVMSKQNEFLNDNWIQRPEEKPFSSFTS